MAVFTEWKVRSRGSVVDLVGFGEVEDAGLDKGFDGLLDEFRFGFVFKGGLDLVFERLAGGGAGGCKRRTSKVKRFEPQRRKGRRGTQSRFSEILNPRPGTLFLRVPLRPLRLCGSLFGGRGASFRP